MAKFFQSQFYHERLSLFSTIFKTILRNLQNTKFEPEVSILEKFVKPGPELNLNAPQPQCVTNNGYRTKTHGRTGNHGIKKQPEGRV